MNKIKKGDTVKIISGKGKGQNGSVIKKSGDILYVSGVKSGKKHIKPTQNEPGHIKTFEMPIHISNVLLLDDSRGVYSRASFSIDSNLNSKFKRKTRKIKK